jgi:predicted permease
MWRMLPIKDPAGLLVVGRQEEDGVFTGFTYQNYQLLHDNNPVATLAGYTTAPINVSIDGPPEPSLQGTLVSGEYFSLLGVNPIIGRAIGPDDDRVPNGHPIAMLSDGYWERRFARDPSVIGRTIRLSAMPFTIVGVTPPEFFGVEIGTAPDIFVPLMMQPTVMPAFENLLDNPIVGRTWVQAIARTKPGVTSARAAAAMDVVQAAEDERVFGPAQAGGKGPTGPRPRLVLTQATAVSALRRQFSRPLFVLMSMVGVVLLIACANTANLLLSRAMSRRSEFAMRLALGAGRVRLMRQLLVESIALAALGGVCGVVLARWATRLLVIYISSGRTPIALDLSPNLRVLAFTASVSVLTGLLFGLAPAWRATGIDLTPALKNARGSVSRGRGVLRPGPILAVAQLALSLLLLSGAGLFVRSLQKLNGEDIGGLRDRVLILRVEPKGSDQRNIPGTPERLDRIYRELIERVQQVAGVRMASMANTTPTAPTSSAGGQVTLPSGERVRVPMLMVYPNYFATIGLPIVSGRDFGPGDLGERSPLACIVNESYVRQVFPDQDPMGKPCLMGRRPRLLSSSPNPQSSAEPFPIVGVVKDSRYSNPNGNARPLIYLPFLQTSTGRGQMVLHVRISGNRGEAIQRIREEVARVDPTVPMFDVHTLEEEMGAALVQQRLIGLLSGFFGVLALLLACVGLYGLLSFGLLQRTTEIGIRMALGARRGDVLWMVVREALILVGIGVAVGVPTALAVTRIASSQISGLLFGLDATDPVTIAGASLLLTAVATFAAYWPARRASRVDPMIALRAE